MSENNVVLIKRQTGCMVIGSIVNDSGLLIELENPTLIHTHDDIAQIAKSGSLGNSHTNLNQNLKVNVCDILFCVNWNHEFPIAS